MNISRLLQRSTISGRLIAFSAIFVVAAIVVASVVLWLIVAGVVRSQVDQRLDTQIQALRSAITTAPDGAVTLSIQLDGPPFDRPGSGWYWQVSGQSVRLTSRSLSNGTIETPGHAFEWRQLFAGMPRPGGTTALRGQALHSRRAEATVGDRIVTITATAPETALTSPAFRSLMWLLPVMALLGGSLIAGTILQVRFGLRPLRQMTADIGSVLTGNRSTLPEPGVEELRPVATEINRLIDQSAQRLADTRVHFANMAHGLKTPVASMMLALDDTNDPDKSMRKLIERIDRRIQHHLADGRKATAGDMARSTSTVRPRLKDLLFVLERIYAHKHLSVECKVDPSVVVGCANEDFDEIFGNILDNAFKWANETIRICARIEGSAVTIGIFDDGPGMPDSGIEDALRPGFRLDETVAGDGFGLSISKEIVELYGGSIELAPMNPGLMVNVKLPGPQALR
ncbi:HAMP domain-containing histidine kinase [Rhizobium sp. CG4]|jgi:signal transduction histidine kinase|uniref:sensor histidine kinase n=1 Tax=unclassified Rhizobium TaxID=2613769 RepID=UPI00203372B7|nr:MULTISPECIES: HAMP domain-containing sensor histidine kinase [unclassified Rhizobium]MCM2457414.1 HAMP domain-containing histidine kinase [Rhizobium sp. CG4]MCS4244995.1 signal transduction histidine kinase [Rhizobium sp. BIGb0125]